MNSIFVSMPSKNVFKLLDDGEWQMHSLIKIVLADLHMKYPDAVFIAPSIQNYVLLPYLEGRIGPTYESWKERCRCLIDICDMMIVIKAPGWEESVGVMDEIEYAKQGKLPIFFVTLTGEIESS